VRLLRKKTRFFDLPRGYFRPSVYHLSRQKLLGSRLGRLLESGPSIDELPLLRVGLARAGWRRPRSLGSVVMGLRPTKAHEKR
jgi:hypothetical protein